MARNPLEYSCVVCANAFKLYHLSTINPSCFSPGRIRRVRPLAPPARPRRRSAGGGPRARGPLPRPRTGDRSCDASVSLSAAVSGAVNRGPGFGRGLAQCDFGYGRLCNFLVMSSYVHFRLLFKDGDPPSTAGGGLGGAGWSPPPPMVRPDPPEAGRTPGSG